MAPADYRRLYRAAYKKPWSVRIEERYEHGKGIMLYLSRYVKSGPINPNQIEQCDDRGLVFRYLDHRDKRHKSKRLRLSEFTERLLMHVPAVGVHTVRSYGLYASSCKTKRELCRKMLGDLSAERVSSGAESRGMLLFCKACGGLARRSHSVWRSYRKGNSLIKKHPAGGSVQQDDETNIANTFHTRDPCELQI